MKLKADMEEHPEVLGFLFETNSFGKTLYRVRNYKIWKIQSLSSYRRLYSCKIVWEGMYEHRNVHAGRHVQE